MTSPVQGPDPGPVLVCADPDPDVSAAIARRAAHLLAGRRAVVVAAWRMPRVGPLEAVLDALYDVDAHIREETRRAAEAGGRAACEALVELGWEAEPRTVHEDRRSWEIVLEVAEEIDASVIVSPVGDGTEQRSGSLSAQARALAHRSPRPVLLLAPGPAAGGDAVAYVAFDGSKTSRLAVTTGIGLLRPRPAVVGTVWHSAHAALAATALALPAGVALAGLQELDRTAREAAAQTAAEGAALLSAEGWTSSEESLEAPASTWAAIVDAAEAHGAAVTVIGMRGHSRVTAALLGGVAEGVLRHAGRPVLLVPAAD